MSRQQSERPHRPLHAADLVKVQHAAGKLQPESRRQKSSKYQVAQQPLTPGTRYRAFNLGARRFNQTAILHSGRTSRLTSTASQTQVDMFYVGVGDGRATSHLHHLENASTR